MKRLIQVTPDDDPQKPDFLFRLGELFAEKQHYYFSKARALDQKIFDAPPNQRGKLQAEQRKYESEEQKWLLEAVKAYIRRDEVQEVRAHGRGAVQARLPADLGEEGRPGA